MTAELIVCQPGLLDKTRQFNGVTGTKCASSKVAGLKEFPEAQFCSFAAID